MTPQTHYVHPQGLLAGFHAGYPDPDVPELVHVGEQWAPTTFPIRLHSHAVWEFYAQVSGETRWDGPDASYTLQSGAFFAAPPHVPHRMHDRPPSSHHFLFAAIDLGPVLARLPALEAHWRETAIVCVLHAGSLLVPFRQLIREVSLTLPHRTLGLRLALDALLLEATRVRATEAPPASPVFRHPAVLRAKELLDHQPARPWRLPDLARLAGLSPHHLVECFTREVGVPPRQYLLQSRIRRATELLSQTDLPITELALELGFSSSQHFAATFKRLTGQTAQQYRNAQRLS